MSGSVFGSRFQGQPNAQANPRTPAQQFQGPSFNNPRPAAQQPPSFGSFGQRPAQSATNNQSAFAQRPQPQAQANQSAFGQRPFQNQPTGASAFGAKPTAAATGGMLSARALGLSGPKAANPSSAFPNRPPNPIAPPTSSFGFSTQPAPSHAPSHAPSGPFGAAQPFGTTLLPTPSTPSTSGSVFGNRLAPSSTPIGPFASNPTSTPIGSFSSTPIGPSYPSQSQATGGSIFGARQFQNPVVGSFPSSTPIGPAYSQSQPAGGSVFGSQAATPTFPGGGFGYTPPQPSSFGAFGTAQSQTGSAFAGPVQRGAPAFPQTQAPAPTLNQPQGLLPSPAGASFGSLGRSQGQAPSQGHVGTVGPAALPADMKLSVVLSEQDREQFLAAEFTLGKIPEVEPPMEVR